MSKVRQPTYEVRTADYYHCVQSDSEERAAIKAFKEQPPQMCGLLTKVRRKNTYIWYYISSQYLLDEAFS